MNKVNQFTIAEEKNDFFPETIIRNNSTNEYLSIIPESGARIKELWLKNGENTISVLEKIERIDSCKRDDIYTNAKLSPFAGRIKDGQYIYNDTQYELLKNYPEENNACHGFIYDKKFRLTARTVSDDFASCTLEYFYNKENQGYPFSYLIKIIYKLSIDDGLTCITKVTNCSDSDIPLADGWHHYFNLGVNVDELKLKLDVSEIAELNSQMIPDGETKEYRCFDVPRKINDRNFDSCFKMNNKGRAITRIISEKQKISLNIWQETGRDKYNYLVVYTPPCRKTIAIEPMTSNINSFNNGEGLIILSPGKEYVSSFGIYLDKT